MTSTSGDEASRESKLRFGEGLIHFLRKVGLKKKPKNLAWRLIAADGAIKPTVATRYS